MTSEWGDAILRAAQVARFGVVVSVVDLPGVRNLFVNDAAVAILGRSREELLSGSALDWLAPDERARMADYARRRAAGEAIPPVLETVYLRPDGARVPVEWAATRVDEKVTVSFITDISSRKRDEREHAATAERFRALVENAPDCIAIATVPDGRLRYVNPFMLRLFGYERADDALGRRVTDFMDPADVETFVQRYAEVAGGSRYPSPYAYRMRTREGATLVVEFTSLPTEWEGARAVITLGRDLTERTRMQNQLVRTDRLAALGTLAAGVAHEINNPLAFLSLAVDALERLIAEHVTAAPARAQFSDVLGQVHEGTARIAAIVRDLKTFGADDEDEHASVDVAVAVGRAVRVASHQLRPRARLVIDLPAMPPVVGSRGRIEQVFVNLLVNAAQALEEGRPENEIRVTGRVEDDHLFVDVADNGPGVPADVAERIFDPFFTTKQGQGTGLGLAICHGILAKIGGDVALVPTATGATFRVRLKVAESPSAEPPSAQAPALVATRHARLLVIDDEPALGFTLRALLEPEHDVVSVTSGEEALALVANDAFDAILCDLTMPGLSGADVYERLATSHPELVRKMIFMTGGAFTPRLERFLADVACPRLDKPFTLDSLRAALARVL